jgi:ABC-type cobalamin/Fe3+-siderophores transport system ATPase subunit
MKLILENFKCYNLRTELNCSNNGLIFLNGKSGAGKSTIFKALSFVLFGKEQKIANFKNNKKKSTVILEFQNLVITRTRLPNTLKLVKNKITYLDEGAQSIINKQFGNFNQFNLTSYIAQKNIESFIQLSKDQKTLFLQQLAIEEYPIETLKENIKSEIKKYKENIFEITTKIKSLKNLECKYTVKTKPIFNNNNDLPNLNYDNLNNSIIEIEKKINEGKKLVLQNEEKYKELQKKETEKIIFEKSSSELMNKIETILNSLKNNSKFMSLNYSSNVIKLKIEELKELKQKINKQVELQSNITILEKEFNKYSTEKINIENNLKKIKLNYNINEEYNLNNLKIILQKYNINSSLDLYNYFLKCKNKLTSSSDYIPTIYNCPCCESNLFLNKDNKLEELKNDSKKDDTKCIISKEEKLKLENSYKDFEKLTKSFNFSLSIEKNENFILTSIIEDENSLKNKEILKTKLNMFEERNKEILEEINKYKNKLNNSENNDENNQNVDEIDSQLLEYNKLEIYNKDLEKYNKKIEEFKINDIKSEIEKCNLITLNTKKEIEENEKKWKTYKELYIEYKEYELNLSSFNAYCEYEKEYNQYVELEKKLIKKQFQLEEFYNKIILSESISLEQIIDTINILLEEYISVFFQNDLSMYLTNTTTLLNGDKKYCIDIEIVDKLGNSIGIESLSGGEYDRCALALFLCFNQLSKSPFLLLDECLSSLHAESVEEIIEFIKNMFKNKCIIMTLHQANLALFDQVINISTLNSSMSC